MNSLNSLTENYLPKTFNFTGVIDAGALLVNTIAANHRLQKEKKIKDFVKPFSIELSIFKSFCSDIIPLLKRITFNYDEKPYVEVSPNSPLSLSAIKDIQKSEREIEQVFGLSMSPSYSIAIKKIDVNNKKRLKKKVVDQPTEEPNSISMTEDQEGSSENIAQLTFDIMSNELNEISSDNRTNIQEKELDSDINSDTATDEEDINKSTKGHKHKQDVIQEEEINKSSNITSDNKDDSIIPDIPSLNNKELTSKVEETSPAINNANGTSNEEEQTSSDSTKSKETFATPDTNTSSKAKKTERKPAIVTIDYIAERIADRSITHTTQFRKLIEGQWKYKVGNKEKGNQQLFEVSQKAKGGDIKNPVQDLELLKSGLRNILIEV